MKYFFSRVFFVLALGLVFALVNFCAAKRARAAEPAEPIIDFVTDGCTGYAEGTRRSPNLWRHCCVEHDLFFWAGGTEAARDGADLALKKCVAATGEKTQAEIIYAGVRLGKRSPWKTKQGFWGNAWHKRPSGYAKLTPEQAAGVLDALARRDRSGEVTADMRLRLEASLAADLTRTRARVR